MKPAGADRVWELNEDMAPGTYAREGQNGSPQGLIHPDPAGHGRFARGVASQPAVKVSVAGGITDRV